LSQASLGSSLGQLLATEIELSERLLALIGREKLLMEQPLHPDADDLLHHKLDLLGKLQQASQQRADLMQRHGFDASAAGIKACTRACANTPGIANAFQR